MIRKEDLLARARLNDIAPKFIQLDYLQDIVLLILSKEFGTKLVFKGGTCLYKVYQLNRFSEDLDFTAKPGFKGKDFFTRLPSLLGLFNIKSTVKIEGFHNNINVYLKVLGPFYDGSKESVATLILNISCREKTLLPIQRIPYISPYPEVRPFDILAMGEQEILAEKVRAIYERNKARDVYDLWYLLCRRKIPFDIQLVARKFSRSGVTFNKEVFLKKVEEKKENWEDDLKGLVAGKLPSFTEVKETIGATIMA